MGDRLATIDMVQKLKEALPLLEGAGSLSNTTWPGPKPTFVPSGILIHIAVWPQTRAEKRGGAAYPFGEEELGPHLTQCRLSRGLHPYQVVP